MRVSEDRLAAPLRISRIGRILLIVSSLVFAIVFVAAESYPLANAFRPLVAFLFGISLIFHALTHMWILTTRGRDLYHDFAMKENLRPLSVYRGRPEDVQVVGIIMSIIYSVIGLLVIYGANDLLGRVGPGQIELLGP